MGDMNWLKELFREPWEEAYEYAQQREKTMDKAPVYEPKAGRTREEETDLLCEELKQLLRARGQVYGDSIGSGGRMYATLVEMDDSEATREHLLNMMVTKMVRVGQAHCRLEWHRDSLIDLAGYAILAVLECDRDEHGRKAK